MTRTLRRIIWRGVGAFFVAALAGCLYCAAHNVETTPFGILVAAFIAPSVILFIVLETFFMTRVAKYSGFFVPAFLVVVLCGYGLWSARMQAVQNGGLSDGSEDMIVYFMECYGVVLSLAFVFLVVTGRKMRSAKAPVKAGQE